MPRPKRHQLTNTCLHSQGSGLQKLIAHCSPECQDLIVRLLVSSCTCSMSSDQSSLQLWLSTVLCTRVFSMAMAIYRVPLWSSCVCAWPWLPTQAYNPDERLSARQALRHPYFREIREAEKRQKALMTPDTNSQFMSQ